MICENQLYTGAPGGSQGAVARNTMYGGGGFDVLHLDAWYHYNVPPLHFGDESFEEGFYDINVDDDVLLDDLGVRVGDYDPNAAECVALVSMFGQ